MNRNLFWIVFVILMLELFSIIKVGAAIGALNAIFLLIADVVLGIWLVKNSFRSLIGNLALNPLSFSKSKNSLLVFAGLLFAFPGFITDIIALTLALYALLFKRDMNANHANMDDIFSESQDHYSKGRTIDGTAVHEDKNDR